MIKINIRKQDVLTNSAIFDSLELANTWLAECESNATFGRPEHTVEVSPRIINEDGTIIEAVYEVVPSEYVVEIVDITVEVELENLKKQFPAISPRQIRLALLSLGVTEATIDSMIDTLPSLDKEAAMIAWKYSTEFQRFIPMVESIGLMIGLDSDALNLLWKTANLI